MNRRFILALLLGLIAFVITDSLAVIFIFLLVYVLGLGILKILKQDQKGLSIYSISIGASLIYALLLYLFMQDNDYLYLQSYDGYTVYLPYTEELLGTNSLFELIITIYNTSRYAFVGSILIPFVYVGKLSRFFGGDLYLPIQFVIMFFSSLASVVVYNILVVNRIYKKKAYKYTLLYSLLSVQFIMSTYIVRDMPITLFYGLLIFLSFKPFSIKRVLLMILIIMAIITIRLSSGIFASIYVFLVVFFVRAHKSGWQKIISLIFIIASVTVLFNYVDLVYQTFEAKSKHYIALESEDQGGASTLKTFDVLPPGLSHLAKATYNQLMPIPSWRSMIQTSFRPESYNVMNFPNVINVFFRYLMWGVIIISLFFRRLRKIIIKDKLLFSHFVIAITFLMLQSSTMGHRRMMGVYPVFFLIALLLFDNFDKNNKQLTIGILTILFFGFQFFGALYLI